MKMKNNSINTGITIYFNRHKRIKGVLEIIIGVSILAIVVLVVVVTISYIVVYFS